MQIIKQQEDELAQLNERLRKLYALSIEAQELESASRDARLRSESEISRLRSLVEELKDALEVELTRKIRLEDELQQRELALRRIKNQHKVRIDSLEGALRFLKSRLSSEYVGVDELPAGGDDDGPAPPQPAPRPPRREAWPQPPRDAPQRRFRRRVYERKGFSPRPPAGSPPKGSRFDRYERAFAPATKGSPRPGSENERDDDEPGSRGAVRVAKAIQRIHFAVYSSGTVVRTFKRLCEGGVAISARGFVRGVERLGSQVDPALAETIFAAFAEDGERMSCAEFVKMLASAGRMAEATRQGWGPTNVQSSHKRFV